MLAVVKTYDEILFPAEIVGDGEITAVRVTRQPIDGPTMAAGAYQCAT